MSAKILHVQPCTVLNIPGVAVSTEQHKVFGRRVLLLTLAWLHDQWRRYLYPSVALQLPPRQHSQHAGPRRSRTLGPPGSAHPEIKRNYNSNIRASGPSSCQLCAGKKLMFQGRSPSSATHPWLRRRVAQYRSVTQKAAYSIRMRGAFPPPASQQRPRGPPDS